MPVPAAAKLCKYNRDEQELVKSAQALDSLAPLCIGPKHARYAE